MKLSTKSRYSIRFLLDMALQKNREHVNVFDIAQRQGISPRYLEQIVSELKKNGYVRSIRGAHGGYTLIRPLDKINVCDVIRIFEGDLELVEMQKNESALERCLRKNVYDTLSGRISAFLSGYTLADLVQKYHEQCEANMYYL
ncbi:MAG: RrF2 family transcriptional regulator [Bacillota bacterium]